MPAHATSSISKRCAAIFSHAVRERGAQYANQRRVKLAKPDGNSISATVRGSGYSRYDTALDWSGAPAGHIAMDCECPAFFRDGPCKHLWAVLLTMDYAGLGASVAGTADLQMRDSDDGVEADDVDPADNVEDDADDDKQIWSAAKTAELPASPASVWQQQLARVSRSPAASAPRKPSHARIWYVLNLQECERRDALVLEFFRGETTARASPRADDVPRLRPARLQQSDVESLEDADDRALVELLLKRPASDGADDSGYGRAWEQFSHAVIGRGLRSLLLPRLAATGRLLVRENSRAVPDSAQQLQLDAGRPFELHLYVLDRPSNWMLTAVLMRPGQPQAKHGTAATDSASGAADLQATTTPGGAAVAAVAADDVAVPIERETFSLMSADLVLSDGLALRGNVISLIECDADAQRWLTTFRDQSAVEVPHSDRMALLEFLMTHAAGIPVHWPASLNLQQRRGVPRPYLHLAAAADGASTEGVVSFDYHGERTTDAARPALWIDDAQGIVLRRDFAQEREYVQRLVDLGADLIETRVRESSQAQPLRVYIAAKRLIPIVSELASCSWNIELADRRIKSAQSSQWHVHSGVDWFELDATLTFDGARAELPELLRAVRRGERMVTLSDGSQGLIPQRWLERLQAVARLGEKPGADGRTVRFKPSQALLLDALLAARDEETLDGEADGRFREWVQQLQGGERPEAMAPPSSFVGALREYQCLGLGWFEFLRRMHMGGCLADDMGLGKTVQVLALLEARRHAAPGKPSIVVVPKSLVFNWQQEAQRFTPELRVMAYVGSDRHQSRAQLPKADVVLTTYATLLRDVADLKDVAFDYAILDEAQAIKNASSQSAKACRLLQADYRLAMSGTPVENHLGELWSLFEFLNPGLLGSVAAFNDIAQAADDPEELSALQRALRPFILRRTKAQVLTELPPKNEQTLVCELSKRERKYYTELLQHYRSGLLAKVRTQGLNSARMHVLEALLRLRQAALHPGLLDAQAAKEGSAKFTVLLEQLEDVLPRGHKALVFSQFTGLLSLLRVHLDEQGLRYAYLDGSTRDRQACVREFQEDPNCQLFLISLRAGGHGLNLTAADYVFILDPWWNPAVEAQAIDRAHRIGQERAVFAYRLIAADTIEEKILALQARKRDLADAIITADNAVPGTLTAEDLELLLG